ncbi:MAG TPA: TetR/AcrR family transcriptional regulator [Verrucomicrobiae bacterium]|jgi:TetR/AcrR family transcriptional repressor of nem operon
MSNRITIAKLPETKIKLVDAGIQLMRARGYNATTVDDICTGAGVTKGGFFHYFKSKDDIAHAAVARFFEEKANNYETAAFRKLDAPLARVFGRLDYVKESSGGNDRVTRGCLIGVLAQELAFTNPQIRDLCQDFFTRVVRDFTQDLAAAKTVHAPGAKFDPAALAQMYLAIVQGSLMLAKIAGKNDVLHENIEQFRDYLKSLFGVAHPKPMVQAIEKSYH